MRPKYTAQLDQLLLLHFPLLCPRPHILLLKFSPVVMGPNRAHDIPSSFDIVSSIFPFPEPGPINRGATG
jgi:hypothetical protein